MTSVLYHLRSNLKKKRAIVKALNQQLSVCLEDANCNDTRASMDVSINLHTCSFVRRDVLAEVANGKNELKSGIWTRDSRCTPSLWSKSVCGDAEAVSRFSKGDRISVM